MTFQPLLPTIIVLLLGGAAAGVVVRSFLRYRRHVRLDRRDWWGLLTLRLTAVLLLTLFLLNPVLQRRERILARGEAHVLVDTSDSMNLRDAGGERSRFEVAQRLLRDWVDPELRDHAELHYHAFDSRLRPVALEALLEESVASGPSTQLGDAIEQVRALVGPENPAAVLVLSDGANNAGRDLPSLIEQARQDWRGPPIHAVGIGAAGEGKDVALDRLSVSRFAYLDEPLSVRGVLLQRGFDGQRVEVTLEEMLLDAEDVVTATRTLHQESVVLARDGARVEVVYTPTQTGSRTLRMTAAALPDESDMANNSALARVVVSDRRIRILIAASAPSPMYRLLYRTLARDARFQVQAVVQTMHSPGVTFMTQANTTQDAEQPVDCLVLCDVGPGPLMRQLPAEWDAAVRRGELALVQVLGPRTAGREGLMPFAGAMRPVTLERGVVQLHAEGAGHPILMAAAEQHRLGEILSRLPRLGLVYTGDHNRAGTAVLLTAGGQPLLTTHGNVLSLHSPDLWWWAQNPLPEAHYREVRGFAEGLLLAGVRYLTQRDGLMETGEPTLEVHTDAARYGMGERVRVDLRAGGFPESALPTASSLRCAVLEPDGRERQLEVWESAAGRFSAMFQPTQRGRHTLRASVTREDRPPVSGSATFGVEPLAAERGDAGLREDWLRGLAAATGGTYGKASEIDRVVRAIDPQQRGLDIVRPQPLFGMWFTLALLALCLCGEWAYRKWLDLA